MEYARQAAAFAVDQLRAEDRVSVVAFDDVVETVVASTPAADKARLKADIARIDARSSTALHAGWVEGGVQAGAHLEAGSPQPGHPLHGRPGQRGRDPARRHRQRRARPRHARGVHLHTRHRRGLQRGLCSKRWHARATATITSSSRPASCRASSRRSCAGCWRPWAAAFPSAWSPVRAWRFWRCTPNWDATATDGSCCPICWPGRLRWKSPCACACRQVSTRRVRSARSAWRGMTRKWASARSCAKSCVCRCSRRPRWTRLPEDADTATAVALLRAAREKRRAVEALERGDRQAYRISSSTARGYAAAAPLPAPAAAEMADLDKLDAQVAEGTDTGAHHQAGQGANLPPPPQQRPEVTSRLTWEGLSPQASSGKVGMALNASREVRNNFRTGPAGKTAPGPAWPPPRGSFAP